MSIFDKFLNAIRLNDDYDEDEDDFFDEDDPDEFDAPSKPNRRFFSRMSQNYDDAEYDEEPIARPQTTSSRPRQSTSVAPAPRPAAARRSSKVTPMRKKNTAAGSMGVCVIKPTQIEDFREIADTLLSNSTVVLNLEGLDVELAQRIIDCSSGSCYAIDGGLQKVSSYIFILTPSDVEISGDIQDILNGAIPSMRTSF